jgi:hypothetical protein
MSLHLELQAAIEKEFAARLAAPTQLAQNALLVRLDNGVVLEIRYLDAAHYSLQWLWGDAEARIDTAPLHQTLTSFPNHWHDTEGRLKADPITLPGRAPWSNLRDLILALLEDPIHLKQAVDPS